MKNHIELVANTYGSVAGRRHDRSASEVQSGQVHRTLGRHLVQGSPVVPQQCLGLHVHTDTIKRMQNASEVGGQSDITTPIN